AGPAGTSRITLRSGYFSLIDGRRFFLLLEADAGEDRATGLARVVAGLERALAEARAEPALAGALQGRAVYATGLPVENVYLFNTIRGDILRIGIGASVLVLLLLTLYYRRWYAPLVLFAPIACGLLLATGIAALVFPSISIVAWTFLGVQVGLGVDFGIHIATHYWLRSPPGADRTASLVAALQRPGRGIIFGALTSAAAFLSLLAASYPILREIAWLTAIGLLAILAASFTVLPLALSFTAPGVRQPSRGGQWLGRVTALSPRTAVAGLGLLLLGGAVAAPRIPLQTDPWQVKVRGDVRAARLEQLSRDAGTSFTPLYLVSSGETAEEAIERDRAAVLRLRRVALDAGVASIESVSWLLPAPADQRANLAYIREDPERFAARRVTADFRQAVGRMNHPRPHLLTEYLPAIVRALPAEPREITLSTLRSAGFGAELDRHLIRVGERWLSVSYIYLRQLPVAPGVVDRFTAVTHRAGLDSLPGVRIRGRSLRVASQAAVLKGDAVRATLVALVVVLAILSVQFRSIGLVARCLVPLVAGIMAILIAMAWAGIPLTLLTLAVAPILLGIGVDDGIHVVERQRRGDSRDAILREAGASMVLTTLTTVAAFACLSLARFGGLGEVGLLGSVGMVAALGGALGQTVRRSDGQ
ncbi:MAG: MMPL family transporter, partial [Gemmatimonadales bacterium]